jgi:predicted PurR-regulated permease PerM
MERRTASPTGDWAARFLWLLTTLALIALALYVVWSVRHVITLMLVCGAIAYLLIPLVDWLARWRPRWIAPLAWRGVVSLAVTLGFLALVGAVMVAFLTPFVSEARDFLRDLPRYQEQLSRTAADWQAAYTAWYDSLTPQAQAWLDNQRESLLRSVNRATEDLQATLQGALQQTGQLVNLLVELFLVPVIVFYLLFDSHRLKRETPALAAAALCAYRADADAGDEPRDARLCHRTTDSGRDCGDCDLGRAAADGRALRGDAGDVRGDCPCDSVIGPVIAGAPIVLIGLIQGGLPLGLQLTLFITALFVVEHKMIMPKIIGDRVDLHPVLVIIVLLISGKFFGLMGMFFGVPVAVIVRNVVLQQARRARTRPKVHRLLVSEVPEDAQPRTGTGGQ